MKTYKRETAVALLIVLFAFFVAGIWNDRSYEAAQFLTLPIFTFAGGAYGLDAIFKQGKGSDK